MAAIRSISATALLALGACFTPALASTGVSTHCDKTEKNRETLAVAEAELSVSVVDHSTTATMDTEEIPALNEAGIGNLAPLADTVTSKPTDQDDALEDVDADSENESPRPVSTRLPGVAEDDFMRLRRQMYRTDI